MRSHLRALLWRWWYRLWAVVALTTILLALVFSLARLLLPMVPGYKTELETLASSALQHPVSIGTVTTDWKWFRPRLKLLNVEVRDDEGGPPLAGVKQLILGVNLLQSALQGKLIVDDITATGSSVVITRDRQGIVMVQDRAVFTPGSQTADAAVPEANTILPVTKKPGKRLTIPPALQNRTIKLADMNIEYRDQILDLDYRASTVDLAVDFKSDSAALYLDVALPEELGERLEFAIEAYGEIETPNNLSGRIYFHGTGLRPANWKQPARLAEYVRSGVLDLALWIDVKQPKKMRLGGEVNARDLQLASPGDANSAPENWQADKLHMKFSAGSDGKEIRAAVRDVQVTRNGREWSARNISFRTPKDRDERLRRGRLAADLLRVDDIFPLLVAYVPGMQTLQKAGLQSMQGDVANLYAEWNLVGAQPQVSAKADLKSFAVHCVDAMPSIKGLTGNVRLRDNRLAVMLDSDALQFDYPRLFRQPLPPFAVNGELQLERTEEGIRIATRGLQLTNTDIQSSSWFDYEYRFADKSLWADQYSRFEAFNSGSTSRYLPANMMHGTRGLEWLDNAFISGGAQNGEFTFRGPVKKMPFRNHEGVFRIEFDTFNNVLNFWEPGPFATNIRAHAVFDGPSMFIYGYEAGVLDSVAQDITVRIDDFHDAPLLVSASVYGSLEDTWSYIQQSELKDIFSAVEGVMSVKGTQAATFTLNIPIHNGILPPDKQLHTQVAIDGSLYDSSIDFNDWKLHFSKLNPRVHITERSVEASPVSAVFNDQLVTLETDTVEQGGRPVAVTRMQGNVAAGKLLSSLDIPVSEFISGHGPISAALELPFSRHVDNEAIKPVLRVDSTLQGIASTLPEPLSKAAQDKTPLNMKITFGKPEFTTRFSYNDWMRGVLSSVHGKDSPRITRADIRLDSGTPKLPGEPGITVSGRAPAIDVDGWRNMPWMKQSGGGTLDNVKSIDILADKFTYLHRTVDKLQLNVDRQADNWRFLLNSEQIRGQVLMPVDGFSDRGLSIDLQYADYDGIDAGYSGEPPHPSDIPPFNLKVDRLKFNNWDLRDVVMLADRSDNTVTVNTLRVNDPVVGLTGNGKWVVDAKGNNTTSAHLEFNSTNVGEGLTRFDFRDMIKGGSGKGEFDISWPAAPSGFDLSILQGTASLDIKKGQVPELDPGGGRVIGLLSLQMIPRRLALDFSDLFKKGYAFDKMSGTFSFSDGNAYTNNYNIKGPVGRIDITGRVGLVQHDYDQYVVFRPNISSSLPVIGALLGGATGGWAMVVVDNVVRIFGGDTDKLAQAQYTVTGSWDDPVITPVKKTVKDDNSKREKKPKGKDTNTGKNANTKTNIETNTETETNTDTETDTTNVNEDNNTKEQDSG